MASIANFDKWQSTAGTTRNTVLQALEFRSTAVEKSGSGSTEVTIMSVSITTEANSKLFLVWHSGQLQRSGAQVNPKIRFTIDGVESGSWDTNHYFYPDSGTTIFRPVFTMPWISQSLTAGTHTINVLGSAYNGTITYDYQTSDTLRVSRLQIMEISG